MDSCAFHGAIDQTNTYFSIPIRRKIRNSCIHVGWTTVFFTVFLQGYFNSSAICHIVLKVLDHLDFLQNITLIYYVGDNTLIRPDEQEVASILRP